VISYNGVVDTGKVLYSGVIDTGMVSLTGVNDTAERRTVAPFTLKLAKQKVEDLEGRHWTSNILGHLPTHRKKPLVAATFWGDAIVIFPPVNFQFDQSESRAALNYEKCTQKKIM
jgi:hypothetical protein